MKTKSIYLNTDLEIISKNNFTELTEILSKKCDLLHSKKEKNGFWYLCVEAKGSGIIGTKNHNSQKNKEKLLKIIEELPEKTKKIVKNSKTFDFNIGWQASKNRPEGTLNLPNSLLQRFSTIGATLTFTVYPSCENEFENKDL